MANAMPWSVRGIDPDIREQAVEAAQRSGLSVGQWLNRVLAGNLDEEEEVPPSRGGNAHRRARHSETLTERLERIGKTAPQTAAYRFHEPDAGSTAMMELLDSAVQAIERLERRPVTSHSPENDLARMMRALEARLGALQEGGEQSQLHSAATGAARPGRRSAPRPAARIAEDDQAIVQAIAEIEMRRRDLDAGHVNARNTRPPASMAAPTVDSRQLENMRGQLDLLLTRIDDMRSASQGDPTDLQQKLNQIVDSIDALRTSPRPDSSGLQSKLDQIEGRIDEIRRAPKPDTSSLQSKLDEIAQRIEAMRAPARQDNNILQEKLEQIAGRIEDMRSTPKPDTEHLQTRLDQIVGRIDEIRREPKSDPRHLQSKLDQLTSRIDEWQKRPSEDMGLIRRDIASLAAAIETLAPERLVGMVEAAVASVAEKTARFRTEKLPDRLAGALEQMREDIREVMREITSSRGTDRLSMDVAQVARRLDEIGQSAPDLSRLDEIANETGAIKSLIGQAMRTQPLEGLSHQIEALGRQIEQYRTQNQGRDDRPILQAIRDIQDQVDRIDPKATFAGVESRLAAIATIETRLGAIAGIEEKLGAIARDVSRLTKDATPLPKLDDIAARLERIDRVLGDSKSQPIAGLDQLTDRLERIGSSLDKVAARPVNQGQEALVGMFEALSARIDQAQSTNADQGAFDALQNEIIRLSQRIEDNSGQTAGFDGIERSVSDMMAQLDQTRRELHMVAETAAQRAAQEAIRTYSRDESTDTLAAEGLLLLKRDLGEFKSSQSESERRTRQTLEALHGTLESLITRLTQMEAPQRAPERAPAPAMPQAPGMQSSHPASGQFQHQVAPGNDFADLPLEPGQRPDQGGFVRGGQAQGAGNQAPQFDDQALSADPRANFIAAARRAAQVAAERSQAVLDEDAKGRKSGKSTFHTVGAGEAVPSLLVRGRKPILLGIAALMFAVGAFKVMSNREAPPKPGNTTPAQERVGEPDLSFKNPEAPERRSDAVIPGSTAPSVASAQGIDSQETTGSIVGPSAGHRTTLNPGKRTQRLSDTSAFIQADPTTVGSIARESTTRPAEAVRESLSELINQSNLRGHDRLREAAVNGNVAAAFDIGSRYADGKGVPRDPRLAARWFEQAAKSGHGPSQYRLASLYREGRGVAKDPELAFQWFDRAAAQGHVLAMHNSAVLLAEGVHGAPDYAGAALWFKRAAEHGVKDSQFNVAILFARGLGVNQDLSEAYRWLSIAADQGDQDAGKKRDDIAARLTKEQLGKDREWLKSFKPARPNPVANEPGSWEGTAQRSLPTSQKTSSVQQ